MTLSEEIKRLNSIFLDTAPVIYYIEAHSVFGPLVKEVVSCFHQDGLNSFSSVVTLTEVLSKPIEEGNDKLARKFAEFLKYGRNLTLLEISVSISERAGELRERYPGLRTVDAIQIATAVEVGADAFLTNDKKLKNVKEIKVLVLKDYL